MEQQYQVNEKALRKLLVMAAFILLGAVVLFVPIFLMSGNADNLVIRGKVVDESNQTAIKDVEVRGLDGKRAIVHTDENGNFELRQDKEKHAFKKLSLFHPEFRPKIKEISKSAKLGEIVDMGTIVLKRRIVSSESMDKILGSFMVLNAELDTWKQTLEAEISFLQKRGEKLSNVEEIRKIEMEGTLEELNLQIKHLLDDSLLFELQEVDDTYAIDALDRGKKILESLSNN